MPVRQQHKSAQWTGARDVAVWLRAPTLSSPFEKGEPVDLQRDRPDASYPQVRLPRKHPGHCHVVACRPTIQACIPTRGDPFSILALHLRQVDRPVLASSSVSPPGLTERAVASRSSATETAGLVLLASERGCSTDMSSSVLISVSS